MLWRLAALVEHITGDAAVPAACFWQRVEKLRYRLFKKVSDARRAKNQRAEAYSFRTSSETIGRIRHNACQWQAMAGESFSTA
jgi:hypothetical protein